MTPDVAARPAPDEVRQLRRGNDWLQAEVRRLSTALFVIGFMDPDEIEDDPDTVKAIALDAVWNG